MARLAILNGKTLVREIDLPEGTLRLGRSDQNDIVLIDPAKAVSRFHAELHVRGTACTVVDLNSQNGTWVAGRRVQQASLAPGQAVLMGTYRLVLEAGDREHQVPERTMVQPVAPPQHPGQDTIVSAPPVPENVPAPGPVVAASPAPLPAVPPLPSSHAAPAVATPEAHPPAVPDARRGERAGQVSSTPRVIPRRAASLAQPPRGRGVLVVFAVSLCLAFAGFAGGIFWWPSSSAARGAAAQAPAEAQPQGVPGGPPTETPAAATTSAPAVPQAAAAPIVPVAPAVRTDGAPARQVSPNMPARPEPVASAKAAPAVKAKRVGPPPTPKEPAGPKGPGPKPEVNVPQLVERARAAVGRADYASALALLEPVMRVDAGNPDALDLLAAVRTQGHDAFRRGRQFDALGRTPEAVAMYEKAVKLLPPDHPSAQAARERLGALR